MSGLFGHVTHLQPAIPETSGLSACCAAMTTVLSLVGVANVVDATLADFSKSVLISSFRLLTL